jgi:hypothetical protein
VSGGMVTVGPGVPQAESNSTKARISYLLLGICFHTLIKSKFCFQFHSTLSDAPL